MAKLKRDGNGGYVTSDGRFSARRVKSEFGGYYWVLRDRDDGPPRRT